MTFCKLLAEHSDGEYTYSAYETIEKFSKTARYEIVTSKDGIAMYVDRAARTTWKRKLKEVAHL